MFGGTGEHGSCRNTVYFCDTNDKKVEFRMNKHQNSIKEIQHIMKRTKSVEWDANNEISTILKAKDKQ